MQPRFPEGTPEYDAYFAELKVELDKFRRGEAPHEYDMTEPSGHDFRAARAMGLEAPKRRK